MAQQSKEEIADEMRDSTALACAIRIGGRKKSAIVQAAEKFMRVTLHDGREMQCSPASPSRRLVGASATGAGPAHEGGRGGGRKDAAEGVVVLEGEDAQ